MERRVLLAITLSFLVLFLYQQLFVPPPPESSGTSANVSAPPSGPGAAASGSGAGTPPEAKPQEATPPPAVATLVGEPEEREIVVETRRIRATFTNRGGRIRHWLLKDFKNEAGEPLDLVPETIPEGQPMPFSLRVDDPALTARLNGSTYRVTQNESLIFDLETADGLRVQKAFFISDDGYDILFTARVERGGEVLNPTVDWGPGLGDYIARQPPGSFFSPNYVYPPQAIYSADGDVERLAATSFPTGMTEQGVFDWAGVDDHYFISAVISPPGPLRYEAMPVSIPSPTNPAEVGRYVSYSLRFPSPPENVRFFFGPKQHDILRAVDPQFTQAIYFGVFAPLAVPLLGALKWLYGFIGNWGWSIIVLTILINLAMFPLRHKSVVAMRKMQELQPQMKAIQERYAKYKITDPERQKMNQEVMELYRSKGVNPASGCVPMLLTMPFLFAFYSMLSVSIELRGAEFIWWIKDLAAHDPYYVTPILMGLSMIFQTRMSPSTADPTQQKVMMFMPLLFTFIFLGQPAGLAIYWLVSNLWMIGQQYVTNYLIGPPKVHNVRPVGQRQTKKA